MLDQFSAILYILTAVAFFGNEWRKERNAKRKSTPASFEAAYKLEARIYPLLWNLLISLGCSRVYIIQFHNGEHFYSGQSIQRYSISQEVSKPGTSSIRRSYTNIPITYRMHELIKELKLKGFHFIEDIQNLHTDRIERDFMDLHGIQSLYEYHIVDSQSRTLGILNLHFDKPHMMDDVKHLQVEIAINQIVNLLTKRP